MDNMEIENYRPDYILDITKDVCPITFVKVRLKIEKMADGETLEILLFGLEPVKNVPQAVTELGHSILSLDRKILDENRSRSGVHRLVIKKAQQIRVFYGRFLCPQIIH